MISKLYLHGIGAGNTISSVIADFNISEYNDGDYLLPSGSGEEEITGLSPLVGEGENLYYFVTMFHSCNVVKFNYITKTKVWTTNLPSSIGSITNGGKDLKIINGFLYVISEKQCYKVSLSDGSLLETYELNSLPNEVKNYINDNDFTKAKINDFIYEKTSNTEIAKKDLNGIIIKKYKFQNYNCTAQNTTSHINYSVEQLTRIENYLFAWGIGKLTYWDKTYGQEAYGEKSIYIYKFDINLNLIKQVKLPIMSSTEGSTVNKITMLCKYKKNILMISNGYYSGIQLFAVDMNCFATFYNCDNELMQGNTFCIVNDKYFGLFSCGLDNDGRKKYNIIGVNLK